MEITDVRIRTVRNEEKTAPLLAIASVTFDDMFAVHDMKVINGPKGLFVAMPNRRTPAGEYRDIAHPTTADARRQIEGVVLDAYRKAAKEAESPAVPG